MYIAEVFQSIQGEGMLMGTPSAFIRTSGCNLRCNWCDTGYASWIPEGEEMNIPSILAEAETFNVSHFVLTGGEPMLAGGIEELAEKLNLRDKHITIETAGTIPPSGIKCDLASLSPKLSNSLPDHRLSDEWRERHDRKRLQPEVLRAWIDQYTYQLKFVITSDKDMDEIKQLLTLLDRDIPPGRVFLMPEGTDMETLERRAPMVRKLCKKYGYHYAHRLHIELFGNTRGT